MVSRMDSICERYAAGCTKTEPKILQVKRGQKQRNAPGKARKRRNRVRFGCWREVQRVRTDGKTGIDRHRTCLGCRLGRFAAERHWHALAPRHAPQAGLRAHLVAKSYRTLTKKSGTANAIPDFFGRGRRTRTLGTRFWSGCGRAQPGAEKGSVSPGSRRKPQKGRCWFGAASYFWRRIVYRLPLLPSKEKHLRQEDGQADQDHGRVGPGSVQLRHRVEIHAVPTSN